VIRARTHLSLYGYTSDEKPDKRSLSRALEVAYHQAREEEYALDAEETELDRQLDGYTRVMQLVDGDGSSFAQVIEDWTQVKKETEECRRDLRRLGWTGN